MHLLVLSAFRPSSSTRRTCKQSLNAPSGAQCFPTGEDWNFLFFDLMQSQCAFWCSVLSDICDAQHESHGIRVSMHLLVLSAFRRVVHSVPYGCEDRVSMHLLVLSAFRPLERRPLPLLLCRVSMHLLVLSAFRREAETERRTLWLFQCTFWCSVLSDAERRVFEAIRDWEFQCTFWCSVLSDLLRASAPSHFPPVSMHLLVLSAFRPIEEWLAAFEGECLNAPSGAQCFPTRTTLTNSAR